MKIKEKNITTFEYIFIMLYLVIICSIVIFVINNKTNINYTIASELEKNFIADYSIAIKIDIYRIFYKSTDKVLPNNNTVLSNNDTSSDSIKHYPETLIIVKPLNWQIYTNNGIDFFHITSNFNGPENCNADSQLPCIVLSAGRNNVVTSNSDSDKLRKECLNINQLNLVKMFQNCDQKISVDVSDYFNDKNVTFDSINCLNILIKLEYI